MPSDLAGTTEDGSAIQAPLLEGGHCTVRLSPFTGGRHGIVHVFGLRVRARGNELLRSGVDVVELSTTPRKMDATVRQVNATARHVKSAKPSDVKVKPGQP